MGEVKRFVGVHHRFNWLASYYQYANRLAILYFLNQKAKIPTRIAFLYFLGDRFPDDCPCPKTEDEWREMIRACHLTLGLPMRHPLSGRVHEVFLDALAYENG